MNYELSRRKLFKAVAGSFVASSGLIGCAESAPLKTAPPSPVPTLNRVPGKRTLGAEWDPHKRTFMAWPAAETVWGDQLPAVRKDIASVAKAISDYEPVVLLARPNQADAAQQACGSAVEVVPIANDDLWARDTVSVFVQDAGAICGVDFNFSGWGGKQEHLNDGGVAAAVLTKFGLRRISTTVVAEGGSFETDGLGTLLITESSVVNDNRNPGMTRDEIEAELIRVLGVTKVIWFPGVRGQDITDAHIDSLARFAAPGVILLDVPAKGSAPDVWSASSDAARTILKSATDARGKRFEIVELRQPNFDKITGQGDDFLASYVNYYVANGAVFLPAFGDDAADGAAQKVLSEQFPGRDIVPIKIDTIASGGGGIHCSTHDEPVAAQ